MVKRATLKDVLRSRLTASQIKLLPRSFDVIGSIAIVDIPAELRKKEQLIAQALLQHKNIRTVLAKAGKVAGRLRTRKLRFIGGQRTKETVHKESGCLMKLNVESCFFSPRLGHDRLAIARKVKRGENVLVLFGGVAPYALVIAKQRRPAIVYTIELSRQAARYAEQNIQLNRLANVVALQGDVKRVVRALVKKKKALFDRIVMPRPQLRETFLREAFIVSKRGTEIHYYDFAREAEFEVIKKKIVEAARKAKKRIKITKLSRVNEVAPYRWHIRIDFKVL